MGAKLNQCWMMCGAFLNLLACGYHTGYPTILFRDLAASESEIQISTEVQSWVVSAFAVTTFPSMLLVAPILEHLGRKLAHISITVPSIITCLTLYFAQDTTTLVIARLVYGFTGGSSMFVAALIIGEYSSYDYRGIFLNGKAVSVMFGVFVVHFVGAFFDWRTTALIGLIPSVLSILNTLTWPESPAWLAYKGRYEQCKKSFKWLRGNSEKEKQEMLLLIQTQKFRRKCVTNNSNKSNRLTKILYQLSRKDFLKPTFIVFFVFVILEFCGRHTFSAYAVKFMSAFTTNKATILYYVLSVDAVIFVSSIFSCGIVKFFRRRAILFVSGTLACGLLLCVCAYLYFKPISVTSEGIWLPISLLFLYFIILNIGVSPLVMSLLGEVYPLEHKSLGSIVSGLFFSLTLLISLKVTPALITNIEVYGTFFVYSMCMVGSFVYLYFFLPETEGKTLQEIEHHFNGVSLTLQKDDEEECLNN